MINIYTTNYEPKGPGWVAVADATKYALEHLPSDDAPYMVGTDEKIECFVFQGQVYYAD